jgi:Sec-independent protein translocase protein TatA
MQSLRLLLVLVGLVVSSSAFSCTQPPLRTALSQRTGTVPPAAVALSPHRPSHSAPRLAPVQMGLFGLGAPEIAVIGVVALFLVGPEKLLSLAKEAGKAVPELKEVSAEALDGFKESSVATAKDLKEKSGPALQELKEAATPALQELREAATPVLTDLKDVALKEAKEVAAAVKEGANAAEAPAGTTPASETKPEEKA